MILEENKLSENLYCIDLQGFLEIFPKGHPNSFCELFVFRTQFLGVMGEWNR